MQIADLDRCHPDLDDAALARWLALYEGGARWRALLPYWLPRNGRMPAGGYVEPDLLYAERCERATYTNDCAPIVDLIASMLFAKPAVPAGLDDRTLARLTADADGAGTHWDAFWIPVFIDLAVAGRAWVWVDLPRRVDAATVLEQERAGVLKPYLRRLAPGVVRDWGVEDGELSWALLRECDTTPGMVDGRLVQRRKRLTWTLITTTEIRRWQWVAPLDQPDADPDEKAVAVELQPIEHGFGRVPVVMAELRAGLHVVGKLHDPLLRLLRARCDLDWYLHRTSHVLLTITTREGDERKATLGAGYYLQLYRDKEGADTAEFREPGGAAHKALAEYVATSRADVYRVVHQMALTADASAAQARQSGESKARDWQPQQMLLASYAEVMLDMMTRALRLCGIPLGRTSEDQQAAIGASGLDAWQELDFDELLQLAPLASELFKRSETAVKEFAKAAARGLFPGSPKLDLIEDEIEGSDPDEREASAFMRARDMARTSETSRSLTG